VGSCGLWPVLSSDLTPCDFDIWSNLKDEVYRNNPHTEEELMENIQKEISEVPQEELIRLITNYLNGIE
jgi:hypothetical protein